MTVLKVFSLIFLLCLIQIGHSQTQQNNGQGIPLQTNNFGYQPDGSMDLTHAKQAQQKKQFIQTAGKAEAGTTFLQHMFQTDGDDDFHFSLPVQQQIAFYVYTYVVQDNTYIRVKNITQQPGMRLAVYEGPNNLIIKTDFFFQKYIVFNGKKDTKYLLKFQTSGSTKLISFNLKLFVQSADINKALVKDDAHKYSYVTKNLKASLTQISNHFGIYWVAGQQNLRHVVHSVRRYYFYELLEMILVGFVSYIQIRTLLGLFKGNSIVV